MSRSASPTLIGAFVVGAFALAVVGIVMFGSGSLFSRSMTCVLYFPESVNGLTEGAPVKLQGVPVGSVKDIRLDLDLSEERSQIAVLIDLDQQLLSRRTGQTVNVTDTAGLREAVRSGLRGRLTTQSFLTGLLFIELFFAPDSPARRVENYYPYPEIPTLPSRSQELQQLAAEVVERLSKIRVEQLVDSFTDMADSVSELAQDPSIREALAALAGAAKEVEQVVARLGGQVDPVSGSLQQTSEDARGALASFKQAVESLNELVGPGSPLRYQVAEALTELTSAARSVRVLVNALDEAPQRLITGKNPKQVLR